MAVKKRARVLDSLEYVGGNIVEARAEVLVNPVNSRLSSSGKPVMGKGVALAFQKKWGDKILQPYVAAIRAGDLKPGRALLFDLPDGRNWAALATKGSWRNKSQAAWVDSGLKELGEKLRAAGIRSVALAPPGCGNGGLDWREVEPMVHEHLHGVEKVVMYAKPSGAMVPRDPATSSGNGESLADERGEDVKSGEAARRECGRMTDSPGAGAREAGRAPGVASSAKKQKMSP